MPGTERRYFGRLDPYCWLAVLPMLLVAALLAVMGAVALGAVCVVAAGVVLLFDSWVNRPEPPTARPWPVGPRPRPRPVRDGTGLTRVAPRARSNGSSRATRPPNGRRHDYR
ncbi:hypothetical protein [Amycolatopsis sp. NBC_01480]|uniref:hypothetical protein n=1 Tax=Amycolatopsis sp. NBC_01480 TaxID=2903562 RepID=UPI002E297681|nr:hypothetical protein [Amycolatopsis sp. NBC_01480]